MNSVPVPHVLVVDDDSAVRQLVEEYLGQNDFRVSGAATGAEFLDACRTGVVDLALLDLRLRGEDGMHLLRQLRAESHIPVIILTGRAEEADRVMGLELGADDYLTKPFSPRELLARIRTVLRRTQISQDAKGTRVCRAYRIPGWELNLRTRRLTAADGTDVTLSNGEFNLLAALLATGNRVVSRDQLIEMSPATTTRSTTAPSMCRYCGCAAKSRRILPSRRSSSRSAAWVIASPCPSKPFTDRALST
jgi:DNA-binding response OmpR family regulator